MIPRFTLKLLAIGALLSAGPASAQADFQSYLLQVAAKARSEGVSENTISNVLLPLTPNQRVIALDRDNISSGANPGSFPPLAPYLRDHNTSARIAGGRSKYYQVGSITRAVEARYGVPAPILIAIWGHETSYGAVRGSFDLPRAGAQALEIYLAGLFNAKAHEAHAAA